MSARRDAPSWQITSIFNEIRYVRRDMLAVLSREKEKEGEILVPVSASGGVARVSALLGSPGHVTRACYVVKGHCATPGFRRESHTRCPRTWCAPRVKRARNRSANRDHADSERELGEACHLRPRLPNKASTLLGAGTCAHSRGHRILVPQFEGRAFDCHKRQSAAVKTRPSTLVTDLPL